ncbi:hypothetical protein KC678_02845 [Candidatus Dojkabacteria bacterium]|uniref:Dipeptidylpeptidase IV N-terminal domain-containing protein n=1 Tax=Candidatus Dojkabacteria bacterium TaxID=2099670 RepID=A0A955IFC6_9BACT|nr:hypothetical protein [Candidatus Dojkabacteria bacterium]
MSNRKSLIIIISAIATLCAATALIFFLYYFLNSLATVDPTTNTPDDPNQNIVEIPDEAKFDSIYATIQEDDSVVLFSSSGVQLPISIEKNEWNNINWSPDNKYVSFLGTNNQVSNLYLYNVETRQGNWVTNFNIEDLTGVTSYQWINNDTIYYTQGIGNQKWLHQYKTSSKQERLKIVRVNGDILSFENNTSDNFVILKNLNSVEIYAIDSGELKVLNNLVLINGNIETVINIDNSKAIIIAFNETSRYYYILDLENMTASLVGDISSFEPVCIINSNVIGITSTEQASSLSQFNYLENKLIELLKLDDNYLDNKDLLNCNSDSLVLYNDQSWSTLLLDDKLTISTVSFLQNSKEAKLRYNSMETL